jgi:hypothetical protein
MSGAMVRTIPAFLVGSFLRRRGARCGPAALYEYEYKVENGELMVKGGILPTLANPGLNQA